jgi:hypothetical protein
MQSALVPIGMGVNAIALTGLSPREIATLRALLRRVIENLERERN